jgi:hypothetical protein
VKFTLEARFDEHNVLPRFVGLLGLLGLLEFIGLLGLLGLLGFVVFINDNIINSRNSMNSMNPDRLPPFRILGNSTEKFSDMRCLGHMKWKKC